LFFCRQILLFCVFFCWVQLLDKENKTKIGVDFLENGSKYKNLGLNRFGRGKNRTEPKLIGLNRFSVRFGSKTKNKIKSVWLYILVQNRTGPKMPSPTRDCSTSTASFSTLLTHLPSTPSSNPIQALTPPHGHMTTQHFSYSVSDTCNDFQIPSKSSYLRTHDFSPNP
jgi:hypothetical protein